MRVPAAARLESVQIGELRKSDKTPRCAYCHAPVGSTPLVCQGCGTLLHGECRSALAKCPTIGCRALDRAIEERDSFYPLSRLLLAAYAWLGALTLFFATPVIIDALLSDSAEYIRSFSVGLFSYTYTYGYNEYGSPLTVPSTHALLLLVVVFDVIRLLAYHWRRRSRSRSPSSDPEKTLGE